MPGFSGCGKNVNRYATSNSINLIRGPMGLFRYLVFGRYRTSKNQSSTRKPSKGIPRAVVVLSVHRDIIPNQHPNEVWNCNHSMPQAAPKSVGVAIFGALHNRWCVVSATAKDHHHSQSQANQKCLFHRSNKIGCPLKPSGIGYFAYSLGFRLPRPDRLRRAVKFCRSAFRDYSYDTNPKCYRFRIQCRVVRRQSKHRFRYS